MVILDWRRPREALRAIQERLLDTRIGGLLVHTLDRHSDIWILGNVTEDDGQRTEINAHVEDGTLRMLMGSRDAIRGIGDELILLAEGGDDALERLDALRGEVDGSEIID